MKKLILASTSPRRKQLLKQVGFAFRTAPSGYKEALNPRLKSATQAEVFSLEKARSVASRYKDGIVLAADTLIECKGEIIGKPESVRDAKRILRKLSGKKHLVFTGFTIIDIATQRTITKSVETAIFFKTLKDEEINWYISTGEPMDKAGAYGINERGAIFIEKIEGDFYNVVGLPLFEVIKTLKKFGIKVSE